MKINTELLKKVINHIIEHPETWDQRQWHCGTTHCIAGHTQIMCGKPKSDSCASSDAREALGLSEGDANWLFAPNRMLPEARAFAVCAIAGEKFFNRDGYDRAGYDCAGYDRDGYNRAGYNRAGYNRAGYNRAGYNRAGYNRDAKKIELIP